MAKELGADENPPGRGDLDQARGGVGRDDRSDLGRRICETIIDAIDLHRTRVGQVPAGDQQRRVDNAAARAQRRDPGLKIKKGGTGSRPAAVDYADRTGGRGGRHRGNHFRPGRGRLVAGAHPVEFHPRRREAGEIDPVQCHRRAPHAGGRVKLVM